MPTYAPVAPYADRSRHPRALVLIVAGHAAVLAAVMMAKTYVPNHLPAPPTIVELIQEQKPPPQNPPPPQPQQRESAIDRPTTVIEIPQPIGEADPLPLPPIPNPQPVVDPRPIQVNPPAEPVRVGPRFATPDSDVKPPYPQSKLRLGEEAVLQLKLTIDERGRVVAVDPVGRADPVFLTAARRHILTHWRYRAATEDGRAVASSTVITLRFQLD
jgi:protein TonB